MVSVVHCSLEGTSVWSTLVDVSVRWRVFGGDIWSKNGHPGTGIGLMCKRSVFSGIL